MLLNRDYKKRYETLFKDFLQNSETYYFDEAALPSYTHSNRMMAMLFWKRVEVSLRMAGNIKGCSVLDFGAGGGVTFKYLYDHDCQVTACEKEFSEMTREIGKQLGIPLTVHEDLFKIQDRRFERIFALDVLEHIDNLNEYVVTLKNLLSEKGMLVVSGPTENYLYKIGRRLAGFSGHYHVRNIYDIEKTLEDAGLRRVRLKSLYPIVTLFRISLWENS